MTVLIFGGTAAYHLRVEQFAAVGERCIVDTPHGPSAPFVQLTAHGKTVWFSSRHGEDGLQRSAAFINHRANIWAARELGAAGILSWNGVGAIAPGLSVGQAVIPDDVLDMTRARVGSFTTDVPTPLRSEGFPAPPLHAMGRVPGGGDLSLPAGSPFSDELRQRLIQACADLNLPHAAHGAYVCTEGPRLETAAEIAMFGWGGAAVVGMTLAPEVWLAAELGIPYASLCIVTNMATGRWHLDARRDFGPVVGETGLRVTLAAG
jgi:5'-methylthioadenosine phosphorylase